MAANRTRIEQLVEQFEPALRGAFLAAVDEINQRADIERMVAALERGDVRDAIAALHLTPEAFFELEDRISEAFKSGGMDTMASLPRLRDDAGMMVIRFNARNPRAESWLRSYSSDMVTAILDDQRTAIRQALESGMQRGVNPRQTALDIVGRYNSQTGRREGGVIGLTAQYEAAASAALIELRTGTPALLRNYLTRGRRDKRFDHVVEKALASGKGVSAEDAARMVQRYRDRLLLLRGETIGRTEALASLHSGQFEALQQTVDAGALNQSQVKRRWRSASDGRVRDSHVHLHGKMCALNEAFVTLDGERIRYPGDPQASAKERINCRCWCEPVIDYLQGIR